jgi:hypothetical protein
MTRRFVVWLLLFALMPVGALAETAASSPSKFNIPWGANAGTSYIRSIPQPSQISTQNCAASLNDGFPPLTFLPSSAGGCPPYGQDFNGILNQITLWNQWQAMGGPIAYSSSFSSSIGGYPKGAILVNASTNGCFWQSTIDNNLSDPDTGGANWSGYCITGSGIGGASSGSANAQVVTVAPFVLSTGVSVNFKATYPNSGPLQVNVNSAGLVNVYRRSQYGATMSVGGEVFAGQMVTLQWDGTEWQCMSCDIVKVGHEEIFTNNSVPAGYLIENGQCVSQTTYADLYTYYGASGDLWSPGSTGGACSAGNFHLPFANGRTAVAYDQQGGQTAGVLTNAGSGCNATSVAVLCGSQNESLNSTNQLPQLTPSGTIGGSYTTPILIVHNGGLPQEGTSGSGWQNTTITISGSNYSFTGNTIGSASPSPFTTVQPTYSVVKAVRY